MPRALARRGARRFHADVGQPKSRLVSWIVEPAAGSPRGTIVLLHGVRMDKSSLAPIGASLADEGFRVVLVDLRGHGESSGRYLTYGTAEARDISELLDALSQRAPLGAVGVYGFSYGGAVALQLSALDRRIRAVVAVAPFSSLREVVNDYQREYLPAPLRWVPQSWFQDAVDEAAAIARFDPDRASPALAARVTQAKLLLIHGDADTQVPPEHSRRIVEAAEGRPELVILPGATHATMPADPQGTIRREAARWFGRWLDARG